MKFVQSVYNKHISARTYNSISDAYEDQPREYDITEFKPLEEGFQVRNIFTDGHLLVEGMIENNKIMYHVDPLPYVPINAVQNVVYGPGILFGKENKQYILMCVTEEDTPIVWLHNGNHLNFDICNISIVRVAAGPGPGVYTCVVSDKIVGTVQVARDGLGFNISPMNIPNKEKIITVPTELKVKFKSSLSEATALQDLPQEEDVAPELPQEEEVSPEKESNAVSQNITEIKESQITVGDYIGEGGGGTVYKGIYLDRPVAIKKIPMPSAKSRAKVQNAIDSEVRIHALLHSDAIVQLVGKCQLEKFTLIVTELVEGPDLDTYLFDDKWKKHYKEMKETDLARLAFDMCTAVSYLHESQTTPIIHRDLKPGNFVLNPSHRQIKMIDLGISKHRQVHTMGVTQKAGEIAGTWSYCAPEKINDSIDGNTAIDVWGLGACLVELFTKLAIWDIPDTDENGLEVVEFDLLSKLMNERRVPDGLACLLKKNTKKKIKNTIKNALDYTPKNRPSAMAMAKVFAG